jgi:hypothetical protein
MAGKVAAVQSIAWQLGFGKALLSACCALACKCDTQRHLYNDVHNQTHSCMLTSAAREAQLPRLTTYQLVFWRGQLLLRVLGLPQCHIRDERIRTQEHRRAYERPCRQLHGSKHKTAANGGGRGWAIESMTAPACKGA